MAVRIRLMRMGKIRNPQYRIVVSDARKRRDGRAIENLGLYHPKEHPSRIEVNSERVQYWLSVGAQPSEPVQAILRKTGDWQKFKGLTPPAKPIQVAEPKADRTAIYEAEAKAAAGLSDTGKDSGKSAGKGEKAGKSTKAPAKKATKKAKAETGDATEAAPAGTASADAKPSEATPSEAAPSEAAPSEGTAASEEQAGADSGKQA